jgi:hypothetical protein
MSSSYHVLEVLVDCLKAINLCETIDTQLVTIPTSLLRLLFNVEKLLITVVRSTIGSEDPFRGRLGGSKEQCAVKIMRGCACWMVITAKKLQSYSEQQEVANEWDDTIRALEKYKEFITTFYGEVLRRFAG